jgi:CRP/FNR family transcriptional regulator
MHVISSDGSFDRRTVASCSDCKFKGRCLPIAAEDSTVSVFNAIVRRGNPIQRGRYVYRQGEPFTALYAVRAGAVKAVTISAAGDEQIMGFYLPGSIFGLDGIGSGRYASSVIALDTATVCTIPFASLSELMANIPMLGTHIYQLMSRAIVADLERITLLSKYSAERRVAAFLQQISQHQSAQKLSSTKLQLPLSRIDISCFLGLTVETVCRILSRFEKVGFLKIDNRNVEIMSMSSLNEICRDGLINQSECQQ